MAGCYVRELCGRSAGKRPPHRHGQVSLTSDCRPRCSVSDMRSPPPPAPPPTTTDSWLTLPAYEMLKFPGDLAGSLSLTRHLAEIALWQPKWGAGRDEVKEKKNKNKTPLISDWRQTHTGWSLALCLGGGRSAEQLLVKRAAGPRQRTKPAAAFRFAGESMKTEGTVCHWLKLHPFASIHFVHEGSADAL